MATLEQRVTALERNSVTKDELDQKVWQIHAILESIVDRIDSNHAAVMQRLDSLQAEMNAKHDAVMRELGRMQSGGTLN